MKNNYLYLFIVFIMIVLVSCTSSRNDDKLKTENDSLKKQLERAENEMIHFKDSIQILFNEISEFGNMEEGYSLTVNFDDPQDVAKAFIRALNDEDFAKAKALGTKNTAKLFGVIESLANLASDEDDINISDHKEITWGKTTIKGNKAVCYYSTPGDPNQQIDLKLINDRWKVDLKKEN